MEELNYKDTPRGPRSRVDTRGLVNVFDNVLEPHVAELIDMEMRQKNHWHYDYNSQRYLLYLKYRQ